MVIPDGPREIRIYKIMSPSFQGLSPSTLAATASIALFTVGEMIWGPRFLQLSVEVGVWLSKASTHIHHETPKQVAEEGREGTGKAAFMEKHALHEKCTVALALMGLPKFVSRLVAGGMSGWLLNRYCGSHSPLERLTRIQVSTGSSASECHQTGAIWLIVGSVARQCRIVLPLRHLKITELPV